MRDRLIKLINQSDILCDTCGESTSSYCAEAIADYLIKSGVIVPPCKVGDMQRYIDADKLIAHLKDEIEGCKPPFCGRANGKSIAYGTILGLKSAISFAETLSTADVVPKSEVERLEKENETLTIQRNAWYLAAERVGEDLQKAKAEVARDIFAAIEFDIHNLDFDREETRAIAIEGVIANLKKIYTEGEQYGN